MPVVTLDSDNGTECTVETPESCDYQYVCTDCSTIPIIYAFYIHWDPVSAIQQWGISYGAPTCFLVWPFAVALKHFHGPLNSTGYWTARKGHTSACCRLVIEKRTIYNEALLPRLHLCGIRGDKTK